MNDHSAPPTSPRVPRHRWADPLDTVWLTAARVVGLAVVRAPDAYASTDGRGVLTIGTRETLDPDDSIAQMILHECCHWLVEGEKARERPDWGLDNTTERDVPREMACLRVQAHLAGRHGLREALAPTTDFRAFYDALPPDPLTPRHDPTVAPAILAIRRADEEMLWTPLHDALAATGDLLRRASEAVSAFEQPAAFVDEDLPLAWLGVGAAVGSHPHGRPLSPVAGRTCGTCAWRHEDKERGRLSSRCRQSEDARVEPDWAACERWEEPLDCRTCGACCRAAYDTVIVSPRDPVVKSHPELIVRGLKVVQIRRDGDRCAALEGGPAGASHETSSFTPFTCRIYADRPRTCRDFELGGDNCLTARRRVGMTV